MLYLSSCRKRIPGVLVLALLPLLSSTLTGSQLVEWPIVQGGNGHFYELVPAAGGITWGNANTAATNSGGYLATITSAEENDFVFNLADQYPIAWYGGYGPWLGGLQPSGASEPAGGWSWVTGEAFGYQNWTPGQPNNNQNEDRIQFGGQATRSSTWNDVGQNTVKFTLGFVVEYDLNPNAITLSIVRNGTDLVQLSWVSRPNITYTIEWAEDFGGEWNVLTNVVGNGTTVTVSDSFTANRRFYRSIVPLQP